MHFSDYSIEAKVTAAREKTEKLRQSILAKAFSGQLVETESEIVRREERDYETVEVFLERIKKREVKKKEFCFCFLSSISLSLLFVLKCKKP